MEKNIFHSNSVSSRSNFLQKRLVRMRKADGSDADAYQEAQGLEDPDKLKGGDDFTALHREIEEIRRMPPNQFRIDYGVVCTDDQILAEKTRICLEKSEEFRNKLAENHRKALESVAQNLPKNIGGADLDFKFLYEALTNALTDNSIKPILGEKAVKSLEKTLGGPKIDQKILDDLSTAYLDFNEKEQRLKELKEARARLAEKIKNNSWSDEELDRRYEEDWQQISIPGKLFLGVGYLWSFAKDKGRKIANWFSSGRNLKEQVSGEEMTMSAILKGIRKLEDKDFKKSKQKLEGAKSDYNSRAERAEKTYKAVEAKLKSLQDSLVALQRQISLSGAAVPAALTAKEAALQGQINEFTKLHNLAKIYAGIAKEGASRVAKAPVTLEELGTIWSDLDTDGPKAAQERVAKRAQERILETQKSIGPLNPNEVKQEVESLSGDILTKVKDAIARLSTATDLPTEDISTKFTPASVYTGLEESTPKLHGLFATLGKVTSKERYNAVLGDLKKVVQATESAIVAQKTAINTDIDEFFKTGRIVLPPPGTALTAVENNFSNRGRLLEKSTLKALAKLVRKTTDGTKNIDVKHLFPGALFTGPAAMKSFINSPGRSALELRLMQRILSAVGSASPKYVIEYDGSISDAP